MPTVNAFIRPTVDYATGERRLSWMGRYRRRLALLVTLCTLAYVGYRYYPPVVRYVRWHYWFREVARYEMTGNPPLCLSGEAAVAESLRPNSDYYFSPAADRADASAIFCPRPLRELLKIDFHLDAQINKLAALGYPGRVLICYMTRLSRPDGGERILVLLNVGQDWRNPVDGGAVHVLEVPSLFEAPRRDLVSAEMPNGLCRYGFISATSTFAKDPSDPCAILMECIADADEQLGTGPRPRATIRGRLTNQDQLEWTIVTWSGDPHWRPRLSREAVGETRAAFELASQQRLKRGAMLTLTAPPE